MIAKLLRVAGVAAAVLVVISFLAFALDQASGASKAQIVKIGGGDLPSPSATGERLREREHSKVRETIDDANDVLVEPFAWVTRGSKSVWLQRVVSAFLALLVYGIGIPLLANALPRRPTPEPTPWTT